MTTTHRHEHIRTGSELARRLDQELAQIASQPTPDTWTDDGGSIGDLVAQIRRFDDHAAAIVRRILDTPVGDETATLVLVSALLPALIHRYRQRPHRIAEAITELTLYIAERPTFGINRDAPNALIDDAARRYRTAIVRQDEYADRTEALTEQHTKPSTTNVADIAIANIQIEKCRIRVAAIRPDLSLEGLISTGERTGLDPAARKRLSRARREARAILSSELQEVA